MLEKDVHPFPKIPVSAFDAAEFRQLGADQMQGHSGLETEHDTLGNEGDRRSRFGQPGQKGDGSGDQGGTGGERGEAVRIPARHAAECCPDEQGNRGSHRDRCMPGATEDPEKQASVKTSIEPGLWRKPGQAGITQGGGKQVCGQRDPGGQIRPQPGRTILLEPTEKSKHSQLARGGCRRRSGGKRRRRIHFLPSRVSLAAARRSSWASSTFG
jgi:hypothetical protein